MVIGLIVGGIALFMFYLSKKTESIVPSIIEEVIQPRPLEKYTIDNLSAAQFGPSEIQIGEIIEEKDDFTSYVFYFYVDGEKVSGMLNIPKEAGGYPIIVMVRGYVDQATYETGMGTRRGAEYLASNGFITISPDFLGYGESDMPSENVFEQRFQTYTTLLTLLNSIQNISPAFTSKSLEFQILPEKVGIWAHSNGGQIALTALEVTQKAYPTALWAPVSKPFPYSILYYTDEAEDHGKALRKNLAEFEKEYDVEEYSFVNYLDRITAPLQLHQGTADDAVPVKWTDELSEKLKKLDKEIEYFTYPGADHNLMPNGWNPAIERAEKFYREKFEL